MRTHKGRVRDVAHGGDSVVVTDAGVVFAPGGLPGERVRVALDRPRGKVRRGRIVEILEASASRVTPACPHVERCGGCPLMHAHVDAQRALKVAHVTRAVGSPPDGIRTGPAIGYRHRARLAWQGRALGYRAARSRRVVDIPSCLVLDPPLGTALSRLRAGLGPHLAGTGQIHLGLGAGNKAVAVLRSDDPQPREAYEAAEALVRDGAFVGVSLTSGGASVPAVFGDPGERGLAPDGGALEVAAGGFSQANREVNRELVAGVLALAAAAQACVLELYSGHGNFTVPLAKEAAALTAVEQDGAAVEACRRNLTARSLAATVVEADVPTWLGRASARQTRPDVVVLDPPRTGAREAMEALARLGAPRVVYISCNPDTLGRDLRILEAAGYAVDQVRAFDMFPQTAHVETLVRAVARSAQGC